MTNYNWRFVESGTLKANDFDTDMDSVKRLFMR